MELVKLNPLIYNTLNLDQYSCQLFVHLFFSYRYRPIIQNEFEIKKKKIWPLIQKENWILKKAFHYFVKLGVMNTPD